MRSSFFAENYYSSDTLGSRASFVKNFLCWRNSKNIKHNPVLAVWFVRQDDLL